MGIRIVNYIKIINFVEGVVLYKYLWYFFLVFVDEFVKDL